MAPSRTENEPIDSEGSEKLVFWDHILTPACLRNIMKHPTTRITPIMGHSAASAVPHPLVFADVIVVTAPGIRAATM